MRTFDIDDTIGDAMTVSFGGTEHAVTLPSAADEIAWSRLITTIAGGRFDDAENEAVTGLINKWVPSLDAASLPARVLVRLGTWITSGGELGNASGAATPKGSSPSSPTSTPKTRTKSASGRPRK